MTTTTTDTAERSSSEIEEEIRDRRDKMDETLSELGSRLTLRSFVQNALEWWDTPSSGKGGSTAAKRAVRSLARQVKDHPMPSLLIGGGLAWLIADSDDDEVRPGSATAAGNDGHGSRGAAIGEALGHAKDLAGDAVEGAKEKLAETGHLVHDKAEQAAHAVYDGSKTALTKARSGLEEGYQRGAQKFGEAVEEYPLGVGVAFLALGALVGLALPHTRKEDQLMGRKSDELIDAAKEKGEELLESGKAIGSRVLETVKEEAKEQGLTAENAAEGLKDLVEKGKEVVSKAKEEGVSAAKAEGNTQEPKQEPV